MDRRLVAAGLLVALVTTACVGPGSTAGSAEAGSGGGPGQVPTADPAFPVTIEHGLGEATIPDEPERVVSIGFVDHDPLLALGVTPVAVRDWFGEQSYATWPWAQDELGDAEPEVLPAGELDLERIAALRPDLIVGIGFGITEELYARLSEIAPTLARPADHVDYGVPWQVSTRMIGRAVGHLDRAEELIADVEARFAAVREAHPEFEESTAVMGLVGNKNGEYSAYGPHDVRGRFLQDLGFPLPQAVADAAGDSFFASISRERVEVFDADLVLWAVAGPEQVAMVEEDAIYQNLDVAKQGRDVFVEYVPLGGALSFSTVLSLPMALDLVVPRIEAALDGDPETTTVASGGDG